MAAAEKAVTMAGMAYSDMEYFTARDTQPASYCREQLAKVNVYVGILGFRYGTPVPDQPEVSYTELEFDIATELRLPRLIFLLDEKAIVPLPVSLQSDPQYGDRQRAFRARAKGAVGMTQEVATPDQLTLKMFQALGDLREQTRERIDAGITREQQPADRPVARQAKFVNPPPMTPPSWFQDRSTETALVATALAEPALRMITVVGRGGVGKTAMTCRLLKSIENGQLPDEGEPFEADGIVYLSPAGAHPVTFANLFDDLTRLLDSETASRLERRWADPAQTPRSLTLSLLDAFPGGRTVVLLDNLEKVVDGESGRLTDADLDEALRTLLTAPQHGVKVLVTTRVAPSELTLIEPGRQRRLDLDAGLPSPFAEDILRALDADGSLGLKDARQEMLTRAQQRTAGYPRALEALAASLSTRREVTLAELLDDLDAVLPANVIEVLVGQAFAQLDSLAQQVMQALAVFGIPVPVAAVDFLLQPFLPLTDANPVLGRLVGMHFARRDAGRYYLHQIDQDYALAQITRGRPEDRDADPLPFTRYGLRHRAGDYFAQVRVPREQWRHLDDMAAQLNEFELRYASGDYDAAALVLDDIDLDYLMPWGHARLVGELHERLQGHLTDPQISLSSQNALAASYVTLGRTGLAVDHFEQALNIARQTGEWAFQIALLNNAASCYGILGETQKQLTYGEEALRMARDHGDQSNESRALSNLATGYLRLGQTERAVDNQKLALDIAQAIGERLREAKVWMGLGWAYQVQAQTQGAVNSYEQALGIAREIGNREAEGEASGSLGTCYRYLGQTQRAVNSYEQALGIAREIGDRGIECTQLGNLGECYALLGQIERAMDHYQQALDIALEIGDRYQEGLATAYLGDVLVDLDRFEAAVDCIENAIAIGEQIQHAQVRSEARLALARLRLSQRDWSAAADTAEAALIIEFEPSQSELLAVSGIAWLHQNQADRAGRAFRDSVIAVDRAETSDQTMEMLGARVIGLCGLALTNNSHLVDEAVTAVNSAAIALKQDGFRRRLLRLFKLLEERNPDQLRPVREAIASYETPNIESEPI
jgi:tetratricopeptide (TPR) repeat protein